MPATDTLTNNSTLLQGEYLVSQANSLYLTIQADGNLVVYRSGDFNSRFSVWASNTNGKGTGPFRCVMQSDGNLVVYDSGNRPTWASNTNGKGVGPYRLVMQNDHNLVIYDSANHPTWASNTYQASTGGACPSSLPQNINLNQDQFLQSTNGAYFLRMQPDGNLVLYNNRDWNPSHAFWASNTNGKGSGPFRCIMQSDGNLVVYDGSNRPTWASNTNGRGVAPFRAVIQEDRNLVIYDASNNPIWASNTNSK
jgi:hypothetical protein